MKSNKFAKDQMGIFFTLTRKAVGQQENIISIILLVGLNMKVYISVHFAIFEVFQNKIYNLIKSTSTSSH